MSSVDVVFFDVGGVILSNGWDRRSRTGAVDRFGLDTGEFNDRHERVVDAFERGRMSLDQYLDRTVFHRERDFARDDFVDYMKSQSAADDAALALVAEISDDVMLATLNNESRELNEHRISTFGLQRWFSAFLSSCYLGARKPDAAIYAIALDITQVDPGRAVFVDDREINLECADLAGMNTIHFRDAGTLRQDLSALGLPAR